MAVMKDVVIWLTHSPIMNIIFYTWSASSIMDRSHNKEFDEAYEF